MKPIDNEQASDQGNNYDVDVVCSMNIITEKVKQLSEFRGNVYTFCSKSCKKQFDKYPEQYVWDEV